MTYKRPATLLCVLTLAVLCAGPAVAEDTSSTGERNELVIFGGISLLDASRSSLIEINGSEVDVPGMRGFFGRFGRPPVSIPAVSIESETSLGSSALFGARYSRLIKDRLALEADLAVAPSHELEARASGCLADVCVGSSSGRFEGVGRFQASLGERNVTAWHYGAGLAYELTGGDVRPLLLIGAGGVSWDGARAGGTDFVFRFGAGLKILFGRAGARVDVVDHLVLDHFASGKTEHDVHASAGLLVRF